MHQVQPTVTAMLLASAICVLTACGGGSGAIPTTTAAAPEVVAQAMATGSNPMIASADNAVSSAPTAADDSSTLAALEAANPPDAALDAATDASAAGRARASAVQIAPTCSTMPAALPALGPAPAGARSVAEFGAIPNDGKDDSDAIQRAVNSIKPGEWLVFPPGWYAQNRTIRIATPNITLWGEGAGIAATNPDDQALLIAADGVSILKFTLNAATGARQSAPWQSRIAVFASDDMSKPRIKNVTIRGNRILNAGWRGAAYANSASAAGIFVYHAQDFLIAENSVYRSLADAIHLTGGSRNGRVTGNFVLEPGDDMVAVVSYLYDGHWNDINASVAASQLATLRDQALTRNVIIENNDVIGQYWGRGITVVGGEDVTIQYNQIQKTRIGAGIYISREAGWGTQGVHNVAVRNNVIRHVQTDMSGYTANGVVPVNSRTSQAGIEIYSQMMNEEAAIPSLANSLTVTDVNVQSNVIDDVIRDGIRIGEGSGQHFQVSDPTGRMRDSVGGNVGRIGLVGNKMSRISNTAISVLNKPSAGNNLYCSGNLKDGAAVTGAGCGGAAPTVTGSALPSFCTAR